MKMTKIAGTIILFFFFCLGAGIPLLVTNSCSSSGDGGSGADFDSSQYYTKTEVETIVNNIFQGMKNDAYQQLTGVDFSGKATTGWTVPAGCNAGFFEVNVGASSFTGGAINIIVSSASTTDAPDIQFTPASTGYSTALFIAPQLTAGSTVYAWHTTLHGGASALTGADVGIRCRGWIR